MVEKGGGETGGDGLLKDDVKALTITSQVVYCHYDHLLGRSTALQGGWWGW